MLDKQIVGSVAAAGLTFFQGLLPPVPARNPAVSDTRNLSRATQTLNAEAQQKIEDDVAQELFRRYRARHSFFVSSQTIRKAIGKKLQERQEELNRYFRDLHTCSRCALRYAAQAQKLTYCRPNNRRCGPGDRHAATPWNLFLDYMERYHSDQIAQIPKAP